MPAPSSLGEAIWQSLMRAANPSTASSTPASAATAPAVPPATGPPVTVTVPTVPGAGHSMMGTGSVAGPTGIPLAPHANAAAMGPAMVGPGTVSLPPMPAAFPVAHGIPMPPPGIPMMPALGTPPWRHSDAADSKPAAGSAAPGVVEVPDDDDGKPKGGKGASAVPATAAASGPTLGLRLCKVCHEKAYSARGVCMNTGCVTGPILIQSIIFSCFRPPIIFKL